MADGEAALRHGDSLLDHGLARLALAAGIAEGALARRGSRMAMVSPASTCIATMAVRTLCAFAASTTVDPEPVRDAMVKALQ